MFIYAENFTATLQGETLREVTCEECGQEYVYVFDPKVTGTSTRLYGVGRETAPEEAQADAIAKLKAELETGAKVAPCPQCGWVQCDMLLHGRRRQPMDYLLIVSSLAAAIAAYGTFMLFYDPPDNMSDDTQKAIAIGLATVFTLALPVFVWRLIVDQRWNPNKELLEHRLALAREISMKRDDYLKLRGRAEDLSRYGDRFVEHGSAALDSPKGKATDPGHFPF